MILDAEDEIAIAQGFKRRTSTMRQDVTQSMVFNDDDLSYMAAQVSGTLSSATANRPRPQHRKPNRDTLRKSMLAPTDIFADGPAVRPPATATPDQTPVPSATGSGASSTAASRTSSGQAPEGDAQPVKPERKRRKNKAAKGALPAVEVTFRPPGFKASELHLTPEQQLRVMTLVKEGTLTMDEAMARVMEMEADVQRQQSGPRVDAEGFTVVDDPGQLFWQQRLEHSSGPPWPPFALQGNDGGKQTSATGPACHGVSGVSSVQSDVVLVT